MNFDFLAPWYPALERIAFGDTLERCRVASLDEISSPRRALLAGEGNGRFLSELLQRFPRVEIDCVDSSAKMLQLSRERVESRLPHLADRVRFIQQDIKLWNAPEDRYDLVVTHFFLDCFSELTLSVVIEKLARFATAQATWLVADFRVPNGKIGRLRAGAWLKMMYLFFRVTTRIEANRLINPDPFLRAAGFTLDRQHLFRGEMLKAELWRRG